MFRRRVEIWDIKEVKELKNEDLSREGDVGRSYHSTTSTAGTFAIAARGKQIGFILVPKSSSSCSNHPSGEWPRLVACVVKDDGLKERSEVSSSSSYLHQPTALWLRLVGSVVRDVGLKERSEVLSSSSCLYQPTAEWSHRVGRTAKGVELNKTHKSVLTDWKASDEVHAAGAPRRRDG